MLNRFEGLKEIAKASAPVSSSRIEWLDGIKGIAILWIVFFHFFDRYNNDRYPWLLHSGYLSKFFAICAPSTTVEKFECALKSVIVGFADLAFHGVGVFIVLSGFCLTYSLARSGYPKGGWRGWYGARLLRLYPMYWFAHLVYLVSPFVSRPEPIDYRFLLSFIGDRIYPSDTLFYYMNPAWW